MTMDKKFVNEYNYTSEDIQEITAVWWKNRHRNNFPAAVFLFVIAVLIIAMAMTGFKAIDLNRNGSVDRFYNLHTRSENPPGFQGRTGTQGKI